MAGTESNGQRRAMRTRVILLVAVVLAGWACGPCKAGGSSSFGFSIHHRFSEPVRALLPGSLPEKGTVDYLAVMAARDRIQRHGHGRRLADQNTTTRVPLTFVAGNSTLRIAEYGYLYYASVTIGTPGLSFLVALDTGSDILWLPCDCISCYQSGPKEMKFNKYELNTSSTSQKVPCSSPYCESSSCTNPDQCPYTRNYLSTNTSSSGYLVQDVLHLATDVAPSHHVDANITFGCGKIQTGGFLDGGAPNGLFGLGMQDIAVPSILAMQNITADSFSMCFDTSAGGRISFGDKGTSDQAETPFVLQEYQIYFVSITQTIIGKNTSHLRAAAIFDTGTSYTYFTEPTYSMITSAFNSQVQDKRYPSSSRNPFEFCYQVSPCLNYPDIPSFTLKMGGGANFTVMDPLVFLLISDQACVYCLGVIKEETINFGIIGENFMSGYRIVFDRERKVLGWSESNCSYEHEATPFSPKNAPAPTLANSPQQSRASKGHQIVAHFKNWPLPLFLLLIQLLAIL